MSALSISNPGAPDDCAPVCLGGRGAAGILRWPPRLPSDVETANRRSHHVGPGVAGVQMLAAAHPEHPASSWDLLRSALQEGFQNIDQRLKEYGPWSCAKMC